MKDRSRFLTSFCIPQIVGLVFSFFIVGCVSPTRYTEERRGHSPVASIRTSEIEASNRSNRTYRVDEVIIASNSSISVDALETTGSFTLNSDSRGLIVGSTPWRWDDEPNRDGRDKGKREPVGTVVIDGETFSPPADEYWAILFFDDDPTTLEIVPQREAYTRIISGNNSDTSSNRVVSIVGGFYPLVRNGKIVADAYPGTSIRSARVAIAVDSLGSVAIFAVEGNRLGRPGVTTVELSSWIVRRGYTWALNLDGGRSAYVRTPGSEVLPSRVPLRRPGPIQLVFSVVR